MDRYAGVKQEERQDSPSPKGLMLVIDNCLHSADKLGGRSVLDKEKDIARSVIWSLSADVPIGLVFYSDPDTPDAIAGKHGTVKTIVPMGIHNRDKLFRALSSAFSRGLQPVTCGLEQGRLQFKVKRDQASVPKWLDKEGNNQILLLAAGGRTCDYTPAIWARDNHLQDDHINVNVAAVHRGSYPEDLSAIAENSGGNYYDVQSNGMPRSIAQIVADLKAKLSSSYSCSGKLENYPKGEQR